MSSTKDRFGIENTNAVLYFLFSYDFRYTEPLRGPLWK